MNLLIVVMLLLTKGSFALTSYTRRQDAENTPFECNSYMFVNQWINNKRNESLILVMGAKALKDDRVDQNEAIELMELWCREYARVASQLEIEAADCPNFDDIDNAINRLGPACTRYGEISSFAMDVLRNFTELTFSRECHSLLYDSSSSCNDKKIQIHPGAGFLRGLWTEENNYRRFLKCSVDSLNNVTECGTVKTGYVILELASDAMFGFELKYADFFDI